MSQSQEPVVLTAEMADRIWHSDGVEGHAILTNAEQLALRCIASGATRVVPAPGAAPPVPGRTPEPPDFKALVNRFLSWPLPASVRCDDCATERGYPNRIGTNLLTASEAEAMLRHVLAPTSPVSNTPTTDEER